jgi:hypothetical protein
METLEVLAAEKSWARGNQVPALYYYCHASSMTLLRPQCQLHIPLPVAEAEESMKGRAEESITVQQLTPPYLSEGGPETFV